MVTLNFQKLFDNLPQGVTIQDETGKVVYANPVAVKMIGFSSEKEFLKTPIEEVVKRFVVMDEKGKSIPFEKLPSRKTLRGKKTQQMTVRFRAVQSKKEYWTHIESHTFEDKKNHFSGVMNTFYDVTDAKKRQIADHFLNEMSKELVAGLTYETRIKRFVELSVEYLCDGCFIDLLDNQGNLRSVTAEVFSDTQRQELMSVVKIEKSKFLPRFSPTTSALISPLIARGKILGTVTFVYAEGSHPYTFFDKKTIDEFIRRGANFLDHARLFNIARRVISQQKENQALLKEHDNTLGLALTVGLMSVCDWPITDSFEKRVRVFLRDVYPADRKRVSAGLLAAVGNKKEFEDEFRMIFPDGSLHWIFKNAKVISNKQGKSVRLIGVDMDITARKIVEEKLQINERKFRAIFETSLDAIIIIDDEIRIVDVNSATCDLFLLSKKELLRHKLTHFFPAEAKKRFQKRWKKFQLSGSQRGEIEIVLPDGKILTVEYSAKKEAIPHQNLFVLRDVTARIEEGKRREHLLSIASHELRTPLASIRVFTEILKRAVSKFQDEKIDQYLSKIDEKTGSLARLIDDLLDLTRIRENKLDLFYEMVNFDDFLDGVIEDVQFMSPTHRIRKEGKLEKDVVFDKNRMAQVIINLLKNAIKYSPAAEKIIVKVSEKNGSVQVSVQDFGIGVPRADHKKIFDIFYRVSSGLRKGVEGFGVGLFISSEIIKKHGGQIWLKSQKGKGSTFFISFPIQPVQKRTP